MENRKQVLIRSARSDDGEAILSMLADLASSEGAAHAPRLDDAALARDIFGHPPKLNILVAEDEPNHLVGFISYYENYSSWAGAPGIHIGDLWVSPLVRSRGIGAALLNRVICQGERRRVDVFVIRDNNARLFYERFGFKEQKQWCIYRMEVNE